MTTIGQGVIEVSADASKLKAGIEDAKRSIKGLGTATADVSKSASNSIDRYVKRLETQAATLGKSTRETELYKLALRGANKDQIAAANSALRLSEAYEKGAATGAAIKSTLVAAAAATATATIAAAFAFDRLIKKAGEFQDASEKTGDSAENIASLAVAAGTTGLAFDQVVGASVKLTKGLTGVDDESKAAGAAIGALGLDLASFKALAPADQIEAVGKALNGFEDGASKTAVAVALFGKAGADLLPFLKELGAEGGRQVILTEQQIKLADEYTDKQAKLAKQVSLYAQSIAVDLLPSLNKFSETIVDIAKDQEIAAAATDVLKGALAGATVLFQTLAIVGANLAFVLAGVGRTAGGIAAQLAALATLDIKGFSAINDAIKEDDTRARATLDRLEKRILGIGQVSAEVIDSDFAREAARGKRGGGRKKLAFDGAEKGGKDTAGSEAKARLALELEDIRKGNEAIIATYANAEKIIESMRSANLLSDREYYDAKRGFLNLNSQAQEDGLSKELARLQAEKLGGKDRIDNDRKILDVQAKLAKLREGSVTGLEVLQISENAYFEKLTRNYTEAEQAARSYLDTLRLQQDRETAGLGQGTVARDRNAGVSQIEDKFTEQRLRLEQDKRNGAFKGREADYQKDLALIRNSEAEALEIFTTGFDQRIEAQQNWQIGASEAFKNYYDSASNTAKQVEDLFTNAFKGLEDALVSFAKTGKLDFKGLADSIISDLIRIQIQQSFTKPLAGFINSASGGDGLGGIAKSILGSLFSSGSSTNFTGGSLPTAGGRASGGPVSVGQSYVVGERGPEIFTPNVLGGITPNSQAAGGGVTNYYFNGQSNRNELIAAVQMSRSLSANDRREESRRALA